MRSDSVPDLRVKVGRESPLSSSGEILGQMSGIARADNRGMTVRVTERVTQDQFGAIHSVWKKLIELRPGPNIVERGPLNFCIGATLGDTTANNDAGTGLGSTCNQVIMLGSETGVGNLKRVEHTRIDETWQVRQRTGGPQSLFVMRCFRSR